jgi:hypothetical protein
LPIDFGMPISFARVIALLKDAKGPLPNDKVTGVLVAMHLMSPEGS